LDFKEACDRLTDCPTHDTIAEAAGVSVQSVRQPRLSTDNPNYRRAPATWRRVIAELARQRAKELERLAEELET
jgi:hypothetical protein